MNEIVFDSFVIRPVNMSMKRSLRVIINFLLCYITSFIYLEDYFDLFEIFSVYRIVIKIQKETTLTVCFYYIGKGFK